MGVGVSRAGSMREAEGELGLDSRSAPPLEDGDMYDTWSCPWSVHAEGDGLVPPGGQRGGRAALWTARVVSERGRATVAEVVLTAA